MPASYQNEVASCDLVMYPKEVFDMLTKAIRLYLLMAEITALKKCMIERYEQIGSFRDPILLQLSVILDRKLNRLNHSQKTKL